MARSRIGDGVLATTPRIIGDYRAALGEGPLWDHRRGRLIWCDILDRKLIVCEGEDETILPFEGGITSIALADGGGYVATSERCFVLLDEAFRIAWSSDEIETDLPENRFNDGKVDADGRFWAGTMQRDCIGRDGSFYRLRKDGIERLDTGYSVTNGPAFSPEGNIAYLTDTLDRTIFRADLSRPDPLANKQTHIRFAEGEGTPDGMTVDSEGRLYVGHFGGGMVSRYLDDGTRDAVFPLPALNITSVTFGGPGMATLYATSAHCTFDPNELAARPDEGATFALDVGARGIAQPEFLPDPEQSE